ncbi:MAG: nucleoside phosphorylase [Cytophagales bacterium]|nr:nucleoside phosphorylase [Cytophagales bacterium]
MNREFLPESELVLNPDGSVYHISLREEHVADTVLLVGDQSRVARISRHFDKLDARIQHREFVTHVGTYKGKKITAISTGIGTDNIDIVLNELHAAANIDLKARRLKENLRQLNLIRIGTSGSLQDDIPAGGFIASQFGLGLDGLIYYYNYQFTEEETELNKIINKHLQWNSNLSRPYLVKGSNELINKIGHDMYKGVTATATGFYGPQGRSLGLDLSNTSMNETLQSFSHEGYRITNFEMETSALYGLGKLLGHNCCTCCMVLANRAKKEYVNDPQKAIDRLIETVLDRV